MKSHPTQFGVRENTASSRRHASHLTVDSLPSISMPLEAATGGERENSAETFSADATVITAKELRQVPLTLEPFVSADEAAQFLCVKRRYLLELSRRGIAGAYALGTGGKRKVWVFRLSELAASVVRNETSIPKPPKPCTIGSGSPR
jgi:hypothetical protein